MPYYRGDYYRGDNYYRGDFLGIGKALKKLNPLKLIGGLAGSALKLTPVGAIASQLIPALGRPKIGAPAPLVFGGGPEPGVAGIVHRLLPGGHSGYLPKRKRMDYGNMKALRRADRRAHGFLRAYSKAVRHFVAKQPKGKAFVHFKKKRA